MGWELWRGVSMQDNEMTATLFAAALYLYKNKCTCFVLVKYSLSDFDPEIMFFNDCSRFPFKVVL